MFKALKTCAAAVLGLASAHASAMAAEPQIKLKAEPVQTVLSEGENGRTYIRVSVEGVPYAEEKSRAPVNVALVIDKSGSMTGEKLAHAKQAAMIALNRLMKNDIVSVIAFDDKVERLVAARPYENPDEINRRIESIRAGNSTAIYAAITQGAEEISEFAKPGRLNRVILLSDGQANVGPSSPQDLERLGRELGGRGISVTTLGLGLGYNEDLMARLAVASDGSHAFIEDPEQLTSIFNREFDDILSVVGQDTEIDIECPEGFRPMRSLGHEATVSGQRVSFKLNQVYGGQRKYVVIEVEVSKDKARAGAEVAQVRASYVDPRSQQRLSVNAGAQVQFSGSKDEIKRSVNNEVMSSVTIQMATERNIKATKLRDDGKVDEARRELQDNVTYLNQQAELLGDSSGSGAVRALSEKNRQDIDAVTGKDWNKGRKVMRENQFNFGSATKF